MMLGGLDVALLAILGNVTSQSHVFDSSGASTVPLEPNQFDMTSSRDVHATLLHPPLSDPVILDSNASFPTIQNLDSSTSISESFGEDLWLSSSFHLSFEWDAKLGIPSYGELQNVDTELLYFPVGIQV